MRRLLSLKLQFLARLILKKYQPLIIGITGSVGKTSTREAVFAVLKDKRRVRLSYKNYNNEIGMPLTILGAKSPGRNLFGWLGVFLSALKTILIKDKLYPEILILELGVDRPGDMANLLKIVKPKIGIVTAVSHSHLEYFDSIANIKKEKQVLIDNLDSGGLAILNYDNKLTREMAVGSRAKVISYGLEAGADLQAQDLKYNLDKGSYELSGINFKLNYRGSIVPVFMKNVISPSAVYAALAAAATGIYFDLNLVEIAQSLSDFVLPPGRMNVLAGIKHSFIIDDTYNSAPESCLSALDVLGRIKIEANSKKYAVLGDMLEIGDYSEEGHYAIGKRAAEAGVDCLIAVGSRSNDILRGALEAGLEDTHIFAFSAATEVGKFLEERIKAGDIILIKGSQGIRLEKVVKAIMTEVDKAAELLVRQGSEWKDK
jgi:UDP-N-acetylmuramoyl-tripeptide--D-alanyl-D-alanine ligase